MTMLRSWVVAAFAGGWGPIPASHLPSLSVTTSGLANEGIS
jgi:hypothetical protein